MATLPASTDITSSTATEGNAKTWFAAVRTYIAQQIGANGTQAESLSLLGAPFNGTTVKTGAYTVATTDRGKVISCSGTWTLSVTAAATLGDGFTFAVWNTGSGTITIDPNLSELIDGATTKTVGPGVFAVIYCNGTAFQFSSALPSMAGNSGKALVTDGNTLSWGTAGYTMAATVATTSGTAIDLTGIPSGVKSVRVNFRGVSFTTGVNLGIQLGTSGGVDTTSTYAGYNSLTNSPWTTNMAVANVTAAEVASGVLTLNLVNSSTNTWVASCIAYSGSTSGWSVSAGHKSLSGALDRIRLMGGTFDAGEVSIQYQ